MPIKSRLDDSLYSRVSSLINNANSFIYFGTYSAIDTRYGIGREIIDRMNAVNGLFTTCLFPPPTDKILWDTTIRPLLLGAYMVPNNPSHLIFEAVANNPSPAYQILDQLWTAGTVLYTQSSIRRDMESIGSLYQNRIPIILEPNTHAKFIVTESSIYEGSGNLTHYGLKINVEVFNFYPHKDRRPDPYDFAWPSYFRFFIDSLSRYVDWKIGSSYVTRKAELGQKMSNIVANLGIRFNPMVTGEKYGAIGKARDEIDGLRSDIWMLPGHKIIIKADLLLVIALHVVNELYVDLYPFIDKEIDESTLQNIYNKLTIASKCLVNAKLLLAYDGKEHQAEYERDYLHLTLENASACREMLLAKYKPSEWNGKNR